MLGTRTYKPLTNWHPQSEAYLSASLGLERFASTSKALCLPSKKLALRVNTRHIAPEDAAHKLQRGLKLNYLPSAPYKGLPYMLMLRGEGPNSVNYDMLCGPPGEREIVVNRMAGEAILKGADVYVPGILAASAGLAAGDLCAVSCALELPGSNWTGINRGQILQPQATHTRSITHLLGPNDSQGPCKRRKKAPPPVPLDRSHLFLGVGRLEMGRKQIFRAEQGVAMRMEHRVFDVPACNGVMRGEVMLQALPSVVAAAALDPQPGMRVLDMCAAPGGKATLLAQLMDGQGTVVALDRTQPKIERIQSLAADLGLSGCVQAMCMDATTAAGPLEGLFQTNCSTHAQRNVNKGISGGRSDGSSSCQGESLHDTAQCSNHDQNAYPQSFYGVDGRRQEQKPAAFEPESFDAIMLDPPCSALGLKPRLTHSWSLKDLLSMGRYQRQLMAAAARLLKPGGAMVYCTCTINPSENESNVRYALDRWGCWLALEAVSVPGIHVQPGLVGHDPETGEGWLEPSEAGSVMRFDPADESTDCIGFFISRFTKTRSML